MLNRKTAKCYSASPMTTNILQPFLNDVAVLLIFFSRYEQFRQVFEQVKKARPSRLYLYQDGPRPDRDDDIVGIAKCREIASVIDWDCEVHTFYQKKNVGCDPSEYIAQKWMFSSEEMGIVLEDDDVPSQSFFPFCIELLERYKNDDRINMICGMNNTGVSEHIQDSYLFARTGSIWGWASWKRVVDTWDGEYSWLDDNSAVKRLRGAFDSDDEYNRVVEHAKKCRETGKEFYEMILGYSALSNNRLLIIPKYNMIKNIGISNESTHSVSRLELVPKSLRKLFLMQTYEIEFPLKHPSSMVRDLEFERKMRTSSLQEKFNRLEGIFLHIIHGESKTLVRKFYNKIIKGKGSRK